MPPTSGESSDGVSPAQVAHNLRRFQVEVDHRLAVPSLASETLDETEAELSPAEAAVMLRQLLAQVEESQPVVSYDTPPTRSTKKLTVGMCTFDDYDGVYFTIQALRLYHPEAQADIEFLVIDNNPTGVAAQALRDLGNWVSNYRYVPYAAWRGTAARDLVFREAATDYVLCMDSHVMLAPGALRRLIDYFDNHADSLDLLQGPLIYDDLTSFSTRFEPGWRQGMYGTWETDERGADPDADPFEIPMQGLGLFACRRAAWPGFNPRLRGFGAEEGYLQEKIRRAGGRTLCLPFLRWVHRFNRPKGIPYRLGYDERIRNYLVTLRELGQDEREFEAHFKQFLGTEGARLIAQAHLQLDNPFCFFDAIYCIADADDAAGWAVMEERFRKLGIDWLVRRFDLVKTPDNRYIGNSLTHRQIIAEAKQQGLKQILVIEDNTLFHCNTLDYLRRGLQELARQEWDLLYLGGYKTQAYALAPECVYLERPRGMTSSHAIAYHHTLYDRLLAHVPNSIETMMEWVEDHLALDQYLFRYQDDRCFALRPSLATQPGFLAAEDPTQQASFII